MKKILLLGSLLLSLAGPALADGPTSVPLVLFKRETFESMLWDEGRVDMGKQSVMGTLQGLGAAGDSLIVYELNGEYDLLESLVGYLKSAPSGRSCTFEVQADGSTIYTSESIKSGEEPELIKVPVKGKKLVVLRIHPERYGATSGAAWGNPRIIKGVRPEDLVPPLSVEVDGKRTSVLQPGGKPPKEHFIAIPLNPGTAEYKVKVVFDKANNKAVITTEPAR